LRLGGSCTSQKINSQDSALSSPSRPKPSRQLPCCTTQASGVPVNISPSPPSPRLRPEKKANRSGGKCRAISSVQARNAGEQPMPISTCPAISQPWLGASADRAAPAMLQGAAASTVRRRP
jgi:hypothetical protein